MKEAVTSFRKLGTFVPTQPGLAREIARTLPHRDGIKVVELGAGEGSITRAIVQELGGLDYRFLVIEPNENLLAANQRSLLGGPTAGQPRGNRRRCDGGGELWFLGEDALALGRILDEREMPAVDAIVSSLPLAYFTPIQRRDLFALAKDRLFENGVFVQYRYTPGGVPELQPFFSRIHRRFVPHFLPAWLFVCDNSVGPNGAQVALAHDRPGPERI
jgi:phospholipid N-methyltransferase